MFGFFEKKEKPSEDKRAKTYRLISTLRIAGRQDPGSPFVVRDMLRRYYLNNSSWDQEILQTFYLSIPLTILDKDKAEATEQKILNLLAAQIK